MRRTILVLLIVVLGAPFARAQDDNLTGIDSVSILVEELNQDSRIAACPTTQCDSQLRGFLKGDVTVSEADEPVMAFIRIDTIVLENTDECASNYRISLMALVRAAPSFSTEPVSGLLTVKQGGGVLFSARGDPSRSFDVGAIGNGRRSRSEDPACKSAGTRDDGYTRCARATRRERLPDRAMSRIIELAKACAARDAGSRPSRVEVPRAC